MRVEITESIMASQWEKIGQELAQSLQGIEDEQAIRMLCENVVNKINETYTTDNSKKNPLSNIRKAVLEAFPDTHTKENNAQYFTESGKGNIKRYQHLALKYLTFSKDFWDNLGNEARQEWKNLQTKTTIKNMTIEALDLDTETQEIVERALSFSGKSLEDFIKQACKVYGTTLVGKANQFGTDLANVSTYDLLNNRTYSTNPNRAKELVKRAIKAIQIHNDEIVTQKADRWMITQTAIQALTGSKPATVKLLLADSKTLIDDHNAKHNLTPYDNRKSNGVRITDIIKIHELVPFGME